MTLFRTLSIVKTVQHRFTAAHISLILIGLMWVLPFLYYYHQHPLTTFYQEWGAMLLGLLAATFLLSRKFWAKPQMPYIAILPTGLMFIILVQYATGKIEYFDQALLFTLYMLWVILLMLIGQQLRLSLGLPRLAFILAVFLLTGSELSALAGVLQHFRWHTFLDSVITAKTGIAVYGNLAQPNHFANYLMLGLISLGLLRPHLRLWQVLLLALPLIFVMVLSGSRSSWLYMIVLTGAAWLQDRKSECKYGLFRYMLLIVSAFILMHWLVQLPWLHGAAGSVTTVQRFMSGETSGSIRFYLWKEAWLIFSHFPFLGAGWEQFAWQHFLLGPDLKNVQINGLYNNAHNLFLQFAAETGIAGILVIVVALYGWLKSVLSAGMDAAGWWATGVLAVIGIHSMLEYPLWYAYFIGIAAFLLGVLDNRAYILKLKLAGRYSLMTILLFGVVVMLQTARGYRELESIILQHAQSSVAADSNLKFRERLLDMQAVPLFRPYAELYLNGYIEINEQDIQKKLQWNSRVANYFPVNTATYTLSFLQAQAGNNQEAEKILLSSIWAFPHDFPYYRNELERLAQKDPAHFAALLKFAIQSKQEYERAAVSD